MTSMTILPYEPAYARACADLLATLPDWFGLPEANAAYLADLARLPSWLALIDGQLAGMATLAGHLPGAFEVHFMAVRPDSHRRGIGRTLLERLENEACRQAGRWLFVRTLAPSHPDPFYARTRAFYQALGFELLFETDAFWGEENPAVVMIKRLQESSRGV